MKFFVKSLVFLVLVFFCVSLCAAQRKTDVQKQKGKTKFTKSDIEKLRWIEGFWRGSDADGKLIFYENYHFVANEIIIKSYGRIRLSQRLSVKAEYIF